MSLEGDLMAVDLTGSILYSVKKMLGIAPDYTPFDPDIVMHINSTFAVLNQLGVGPETPYTIEGGEETWEDFIVQENTEDVKSYMFLKVKMFFDPPTTATMYESYQKMISELEWRLTIAADPEE